MPRIEITEVDLTNPGNRAAETDIVYIPGFVDLTQTELYDVNGKYIGLKAFVPTYFNNVRAFETAVGARGARFESEQLYTDLITMQSDGSYTGFDANAVPYSKVMFAADTVDPSYVMAKELLAAGLPIVYERINKDPDYVEVTTQPSDWNTSYVNYYNKIDVYTPVNSATVPALFTEFNQGDLVPEAPEGVKHNYYTRKIDANTLKSIYTPVELESPIINTVGEETYFNTQCFMRTPNSVDYFSFEPVEFGLSPKFEDDKYFIMKEAEGVTSDDFTSYYVINETGDAYVAASGDYSESTIYYAVAEAQEEEFVPGALVVTKSEDETRYNKVIIKITPEFLSKDPVDYYVPEINSNGYVKLTEEPVNWGESDVFTLVSYIKSNTSDGEITIPANWAKTYSKYFELSSVISSLSNVKADKETGPEFKNIYEHNDFINIAAMYNGLATVYNTNRADGLTDMGHVSIKYLTSGGYPTYEYNDNQLVNAMIELASKRGDCVAFIDHTNNSGRTTNPNNGASVYAKVLKDASFSDSGEFATMFTPWMNHTRVTTDSDVANDATVTMSATFSYLLALAESIKTNANWLAIAGSTRGQVPNLQSVPCDTVITNGVADKMQPRDDYSINAITNIEPYGHVIWGNRTLKNNAIEGNLTATSFLNIRNLVSDVKKLCYATCKKYTFEPNNDILWVNIKSSLQPTLQRMTSGYGISGYKIVRDLEHEKASEKATLCFKVILYPVYAVEDFYITVVLTDDEVSVE